MGKIFFEIIAVVVLSFVIWMLITNVLLPLVKKTSKKSEQIIKQDDELGGGALDS